MTYKGVAQNGTVVLDDAMERLHLLYKINRGIEQADAGQTVSHEEARERLGKWLE